MNSTASLYNLLGGHEVVKSLVDVFYERLVNDERVNQYFANIDLERQHKHQTAFISQVLGGPGDYSGRSMHKAHAHLNINKADFDCVAGHLVKALEQHSVPQHHIDTIISEVATLEREIVAQPKT